MPLRPNAIVLLAGLAGGWSALPLLAQDRLIRTFDQAHGLDVPTISALTQDSLGYLWIGSEAGLYRFDGSEMRRWAADSIAGGVYDLAVAPDGRIVARQGTGRLFEVTQRGARSLPSPTALRHGMVGSVAFDRGGVLWVASADTAAWLDPASGRWQRLDPSSFDGERVRTVVPDAAEGVLVLTYEGLWRAGRDREPFKLITVPVVVDAVATGPDRMLILVQPPSGPGGRVLEIADGVATERLALAEIPPGRAIALVERGGTIWVVLDRFLVAVRAGESPELLGWDHGILSGGPILVDREGSLWLGTFSGLLQMPEPDTRTWAEREGLPSRHTRFLARTQNTLWVSTWAGLGYLRRSSRGTTAADLQIGGRGSTCVDDRGAVWTSAGGSLLELADTVVTRWPVPGPASMNLFGCVADRDSGVWFGTNHGVYYTDAARTGIRQVPGPLVTSGGLTPVLLHDRQDRVWASAGESICHAPARRVLAGEDGQWTCANVPDVGYVTTIVELPGGALWAASDQQGILKYEDGAWRPLPMPDEPTRRVFALRPSPRGGWWMVGVGMLKRIAATDTGWTVLEELTSWHGLAAASGSDIVEDEDGTLWIATNRGVVQVPGNVRSDHRPAPPVALVAASVDEQSVHVDSIAGLRQGRNRLTLDFAALSFRDPARIRHQIRMRPDEAWSESRDRPSFRLVDLQSGDYGVEYRASLDGREWSEQPLRVTFRVHPQWYRTWWFLALGALLAVVLAWAVYRARVAFLLRLERQRTRIALDLHDEVGSGLASVGILSGVLASDVLDVEERRQAATEIASAAEELGHALSDIVWSLDTRVATLEELASRLAEHAGRLFADADTVLATRLPERWPAERPDVTVRRNVLLVGLEALHNVARHAHARHVVLSLAPVAGDWELCISDDGVGFDAAGAATTRSTNGARPGTDSGHGLPGMRQRAAEIGAQLTVQPRAGGGTTLCLRFRLVQSRGRAFHRLARFAGL
jgi:signal transduction histidine kinase/ligand-binding sensor domain-containing protein